MHSHSISCYRLLGNQRIDGRLTLRKNALHFEADFPSRHRLYVPLYQLIGLHHEEDPVPMIRILSEFGTVAFYPIQDRPNEKSTCVNNLVTQIRRLFAPPKTPWLALTDQSTDEVQNTNPLHSYIEGQYSVTGNAFAPCAVQIHQETIHILARDQGRREIVLRNLCQVSCTRSWLSNTLETRLCFNDTTLYFRGSHSIQLWAITDSIQNDAHLLHSWNDKRHWWRGPCTINLLSTGIRWYGIDLLKSKGQFKQLDWTSIHTVDFSGRTLSVQTDQGPVSLGQRHSTTFYKNIVERMLEAMCHSFETRLVGLWDENRKVHMGTLTLSADTLTFLPRNPSLSPIEYNLHELWMPELFDSGKAFIQIRVPSLDPTPQWIVIHCGNSDIAQSWVSVLNLPSKRIAWNELTLHDKMELFTHREATLHHPDHHLTTVQFGYQNGTLSILTTIDTLPLEIPLELWFNDNQRKFKMHTQIEYKQDIPVKQWILQPPLQLDIYNFRAHHRTQVDLGAHLIPIRWNVKSGWIPDLNASLPTGIKDLSYTGCALELEEAVENCQMWLLQVSVPSHTTQLIGQVRYQRHQHSTNLWRIGFQFISRRSQTVRDLLSSVTEDESLQVSE